MSETAEDFGNQYAANIRDEGYESDGNEGFGNEEGEDFPLNDLCAFGGLYEGRDKSVLGSMMELMAPYSLIRFPCYVFTNNARRHVKFRLNHVITKAVKSVPPIIFRHFVDIVSEERSQVFHFAAMFYDFENPWFYFWFCDFKSQFHFLDPKDSDDKYFENLRGAIHYIETYTYSKFCLTMVLWIKYFFGLLNGTKQD